MEEVLKNKHINIRQIRDNLGNLPLHYKSCIKISIRKGSEKIASEPFISFRTT